MLKVILTWQSISALPYMVATSDIYVPKEFTENTVTDLQT